MKVFQSTPPARGATITSFNEVYRTDISIHAPREGGDLRFLQCRMKFLLLFQSTPPARGATVILAALLSTLGISIHAPREGGDMILRRGTRNFLISIHAPREGGDDPLLRFHAIVYNFNPRPPRGGRL